MKGKTTLVTKDFTENFNKIINRFRNDDVLIGIPEGKAARTPGEGDDTGINNATILAINEFGSPANNIPPRPVMAIGIRNAQKPIADEYKKAIKFAFKQGLSALDVYWNRVGLIASNSVKKAINSQEGIDAPSEATLRSRKSKGFSGNKALIVTAQMRNAITYVLRTGNKK